MSTLAAERTTLTDLAARSSWAERLLAFVERGHARACAALLLLSLLCFLPGFVSLQPMDRDEPRFAQASKQMLASGDFVDIRFQDEARHKKPVGIYWLQSASVAAAEALGVSEARTTIAAYRVPSLLGALATVLLTYWAALAFVGRRGAFLSASFMAACVVLMVEARLAKTDAVLAACAVATMGALARAYLDRASARLPLATVLVFWFAFALGVLVKGPMIALFAGLPAATLCARERSARWLWALRPGLGLALTLLVVAPWFVAIALKSGGAFFAASVGQDMLGKVGSAQTYHWAPPGFYLAAFFATFWPAAILAAIAVPFFWAQRRDDGVAFLLAWTVPAWLVFEAVPTKLPHYVLPLFPAIAIATALAIGRGFVGPHRPLARVSSVLIPLLPASLAIALAAAAWSLDRTIAWAALPVLIAASLIAFLAWRSFVAGEVTRAALTSVASAAALAVGVFGLTQPALSALKLSPRLAAVAEGLTCPTPEIGTVGYREPSLVFLTGTGLRMFENGRDAAAFVTAGRCRLVFVERRHEEVFRAALDEAGGLRPTLATRVIGFNINGGRRLDIGAYVVEP